MNMTLQTYEKATPSLVSTPIRNVLRRQCPLCKNDGQEKRLNLQSKAEAIHGIPPIVHEVLRSPGQPLDAGTRAFMEPSFGHDFSRVRVHTDAKAQESARAVKAIAYTVGNDIAFAPGRYVPGSLEGRRLLAHELTHVLQQQNILQNYSKDENQEPYESEANRAADAVTSGAPVPTISTSGLALRKNGDPRSGDASARADRAMLMCDMTTLCQLRFSNPDVVSRDRVFEAYRACHPGSGVLIRDPCLFPDISMLQSIVGEPGPAAAQPAAGAPASGGISLPSTEFQFSLGPARFNVSIPSSVSATLPIPFRGASRVELNLTGGVTGEFSFSVTINAVPHVRIIARAGVRVTGQQRATAGLVIQTTRTTCQAVDEASARSTLQGAGEKLRDAIRNLQNPPPSGQSGAQSDPASLWVDFGSAIYGVHSAIERVRAGCSEVPVASVEFGARMPLEPFTPSIPPTEAERGLAPYAGVTATLHF